MNCNFKGYFLDKGYRESYDRFVQLPAGDLITVPAADAIHISSSAPISVTITPSGLGATPFTTQVNSLFVLDSPFISVTISDVDGTVPVVRIAGFTQDPSA